MESMQLVPEVTIRYTGKNAQEQRTDVNIGPVTNGIALDTVFPYGEWCDVLVGKAYDSPGCAAAAGMDPSTDPITNLTLSSLHATFNHYLMFRPGGNGVPVALRRVDWTLSMAATNAQSQNLLDTLIEGDCAASLAADNVLVSTNPTWSNYISGWIFRKNVTLEE
jgi:hypothetical protein